MTPGVSLSQYIRFSVFAMISMLAGSHVVHSHYQPLSDLNEYILKELKNYPEDIQEKVKEELKKEGVLD